VIIGYERLCWNKRAWTSFFGEEYMKPRKILWGGGSVILSKAMEKTEGHLYFF
jgi:hypothetical protein